MTISNKTPAISSKKEQVRQMFNSIAGSYDFLNHFLSLGIDRRWRRRLVREVKPGAPKRILDVATGTADLALELARLKPEKIVGVDISEKMLQIGEDKVRKRNLHNIIHLQKADSENLPFESNSFDLVTVAFGVRNFENLETGLAELHRVVRDGGTLAVLEFSMPQQFLVRQLYLFYFKQILPFLGRLISGNKSAYIYLPDSVQAFPCGQMFEQLLYKTGFIKVRSHKLHFGIATLYVADC
ncbi:MAG: bifunctional demethylmenaquinone methyltransferase/2-methoxy-6-polyprenyl-1,4-benzoquinol methylase UbiE [Bacteroidales bacterium]|nr:bifunctional demethylmenaquinone methyltransferase/2-methoxy-6-polyprenyl-1,4-benzoquinol methylase UbiE [Bacteroidales bacterium]MDZ4203563.1 bifunctional demethylmenaquinone methyltransferase/2-methoxy-6-polyprenyl-1,4-benzoquinol methylase UbiE [Bacteroidales bacterium]